jgi:glycosyltransferase involved in cell wall biosynthesis
MLSVKTPILISYNIFRNPKSDGDLIERLNLYGENLSNSTREKVFGLTLISTSGIKGKLQKKIDSRYLNFINPNVNFFHFFLYIRKYVKQNEKKISVIISGDPWLDFILIKVALIRLDLAVQVSIHGEPYLPVNYMKNIPSLVKNIWLRLLLRKSDSVRVVSIHQVEPIVKNYKVKKSQIVIAPIPVRIPYEKPKGYKRKNTIVFLGRLHSERGIELWIQLITSLYKIRQDFDVIIIGDGDKREEFEKALSRSANCPSYRFVGWIEQQKLPEYLTGCKVLLNTASTESNGVAMREAQMLGLNIVSYSNNGAIANLSFFGRGIHIFENPIDGITKLNKAIDENFNPKAVYTYRRMQAKMNQHSLEILVRSWLSTKKIK